MSHGKVLYHIGRRPPVPRPITRCSYLGSGVLERHGHRYTENVVFLSPHPYLVWFNHHIKGNIYAYKVPHRVLVEAGRVRFFDGAPEVVLTEKQWKYVRFLGRAKKFPHTDCFENNVTYRVAKDCVHLSPMTVDFYQEARMERRQAKGQITKKKLEEYFQRARNMYCGGKVPPTHEYTVSTRDRLAKKRQQNILMKNLKSA